MFKINKQISLCFILFWLVTHCANTDNHRADIFDPVYSKWFALNDMHRFFRMWKAQNVSFALYSRFIRALLVFAWSRVVALPSCSVLVVLAWFLNWSWFWTDYSKEWLSQHSCSSGTSVTQFVSAVAQCTDSTVSCWWVAESPDRADFLYGLTREGLSAACE